ncbi:hypothetical protein Sjap_011112 [Stephania japonica]|uniref:Carotenoid 9,10(9',10')-cleavage dioxygenase 1-like n=1 Tax=Stephania japonica TaxID=461633 RepID=A0AAP0JBS5_9MAGN
MQWVPAAPIFSMKSSSSSLSQPISKKLKKPEQVGKKIPFESLKAVFATLVNAFVNSAFKFGENHTILQGNFAPVDEIGEAVVISNIEGQIPMDFPEGIRFGKTNKDNGNTSIFQHGKKVYTVAEDHLPYEINIANLDTYGSWDINGTWNRPFTSHPKVAPQTGELIIMGSDVKKPYYVLGVISGKYIILTFIHFEKDKESRIGVMARYGDAESIIWFQVQNHCTFHLINSFEDGDEVVVRGCRTTGSFIPGPSYKTDEYQWYQRAYRYTSIESEGFDPSVDSAIFPRPYEWRLNLKTQKVTEAFLTGTEYAMDFPTMNSNFLGYKNKYAYTQVLDSAVSSKSGMPNFKMFAKLSFDEKEKGNGQFIKEEYHRLEEGTFCSGLQFVGKPGGVDEDDGWLVCYVHDERRNVSQVYLVDARKFSEEPIAKITLPQRVPCGFHASFIPKDSFS